MRSGVACISGVTCLSTQLAAPGCVGWVAHQTTDDDGGLRTEGGGTPRGMVSMWPHLVLQICQHPQLHQHDLHQPSTSAFQLDWPVLRGCVFSLPTNHKQRTAGALRCCTPL